MKIACIGYRNWAIKIYNILKIKFPKYNFLILRKKNFTKKQLKKFNPDLILFYGWSWIIKKDIYENYFCVMLHPSPLPKFRGGTPIQNQIIAGKKISSVTLFKINKILDGGPIIAKKPYSLEGSMSQILARITKIGVTLSIKLINNNYKLKNQNLKNSKIYRRLTPSESEITIKDLKTKTGLYLFNKIRMLQNPYPRAFIKTVDGKKLIINSVELKNSIKKKNKYN